MGWGVGLVWVIGLVALVGVVGWGVVSFCWFGVFGCLFFDVLVVKVRMCRDESSKSGGLRTLISRTYTRFTCTLQCTASLLILSIATLLVLSIIQS